MAPARVLWLAKGLGRGGAEHLLVRMARHVDRRRFEVDVAHLMAGNDALALELEALGVRVHCLHGGASADLRWVGELATLLRRRTYDLLNTHAAFPAIGARFVAGRLPIVHTEHNLWRTRPWATYVGHMLTLWRNRMVIAVSHEVAASMRVPWTLRWLPETPVEVIHNGVEVVRAPRGAEARVEARRRLGLGDDALVVGHVGSFFPKKDHSTLLAAFARVVARHHADVRLVLVGSGPLEGPARSHVAGLDLAERVIFAGSRSDVVELLPALDVFVLSSTVEGLPVALLEAMAAGLPAVVTRVGGIPEAVEDGESGLLVPPHDPAALADAVLSLLADGLLRVRMGERARERATEFDIRDVTRRVEQVYDRVLGNGPACRSPNRLRTTLSPAGGPDRLRRGELRPGDPFT